CLTADERLLFCQQFLDLLAHELFAFAPLPVELPVPPIAHEALFVDEVHGRPDVIAPGLPGLEVSIDGNRKVQSVFFRLAADAVDDLLAFGLGRVNTDDRHTLATKLLLPTLVPRVIVDAVDSAKRPEVQDDDVAAQFVKRE